MAGGSRDVAIVATGKHAVERDAGRNEIEMLIPVVKDVLAQVGKTTQEIGFTVSGSSDYLAGQPFAFVSALDSVGAWPPIQESHVEMDGAWALYEGWVRLQHGDIDTVLVYAFGQPSMGDIHRVQSLQLNPYLVAPMYPDTVSLAGLQARALLESDGVSPEDLAAVAARARGVDVDEILAQPLTADPLGAADCPAINDGCAVLVLAAEDAARELSETPVWIRGIDHRIDVQALGLRDLARSPSAERAAEVAGVADGPVDFAELHARFSHEEIILRRALGLGDDVTVNPSGGALASDPFMATGLMRFVEAADRIAAGEGSRAVAHAQSGHCLQQNLVAVLEGSEMYSSSEAVGH